MLFKLCNFNLKYNLLNGVNYKEGDDIYIPVDIIQLLSERYNTSTLPLDIQYDIYLENYLATIHPNKEEEKVEQ